MVDHAMMDLMSMMRMERREEWMAVATEMSRGYWRMRREWRSRRWRRMDELMDRHDRMAMYSPAMTIVEECSREDAATGVGADIA
jgi:hypothetical protein